jgi:hypothetical protein
MRLKFAIIFIGAVLGILFFNSEVLAQCDGGCQVYGPLPCNCENIGGDEVCNICYYDNCDGSCDQRTCGPGYYYAGGTCHAIGDGSGCECGVKADGSCKPCGSGGECRTGYGVSCPVGWTPAWNQPDYDFCYIDDFGNKLCQPVQLGNAQKETGCCGAFGGIEYPRHAERVFPERKIAMKRMIFAASDKI